MTCGGSRSAARSAARCRGSPSRAFAAVPGSSASTTTARRWSRCAQKREERQRARAAKEAAKNGGLGAAPRRTGGLRRQRRSRPKQRTAPREAVAGDRSNQASPVQRTQQVASRRVRHARGHRPLGKDHPGRAARRGARARDAAPARAGRDRRRRADPRAAQGPRHRARPARRAAPVLRRARGALRPGDPAGARGGPRRGLRPLHRLDRRLSGRGPRAGSRVWSRS